MWPEGITEQIWGEWYWKLILLVIVGIPLSKLALFLMATVIKQLLPMTDLKSKYCAKDKESWAVVTGATDGIGLGFCQVLTKLGFNIVLISRNPQKLETTVSNLEKIRPAEFKEAKFKTITFDFKNSSDKEKWNQMLSQLEGLDLCLFVNNVGIDIMKFYHKYSYQDVQDMVNVNIVSMAALIPPVLTHMAARKTKSAIINLSSFLGERALPFVSMYSATKAFNLQLTQGIALEYPHIDIMCLKPMFVESPLSQQKKGFLVPDRRQCAWDSLKQLRWSRCTYGYYSHRITAFMIRNLIPQIVYNTLVNAFTVEKAIKIAKVKMD